MLGILNHLQLHLGNLEKMQEFTQVLIKWKQDHHWFILLTDDYRYHRSFCKTHSVGGTEYREIFYGL